MSSSPDPRPERPPKSASVPRWLPISLLTVSAVALVAPLVLLRRHRARALQGTSARPAPPPRRAGARSVLTPRTAPVLAPVARHTPAPARTALAEARAPSEDNFNAALYCAKAFGIATALVAAGATASVVGAKAALGIRDTQEFAQRMRGALRIAMPMLLARIHRAPDPDPDPADVDADVGALPADADWSWPDAEARLRAAYDENGFAGWAQAMLVEVEAEGRAEQVKRGLDAAQQEAGRVQPT